MHEELVKRLRNRRICVQQSGSLDDFPLLREAADAIEELNAYVRQIEELRKDGYYLQKTKMMTCGQAIMIQPLPQPPKEET